MYTGNLAPVEHCPFKGYSTGNSLLQWWSKLPSLHMHSMYVVAVGDVVVSVEGIHVVGRIWCRVTVGMAASTS